LTGFKQLSIRVPFLPDLSRKAHAAHTRVFQDLQKAQMVSSAFRTFSQITSGSRYVEMRHVA
jgi:hypothetical protein